MSSASSGNNSFNGIKNNIILNSLNADTIAADTINATTLNVSETISSLNVETLDVTNSFVYGNLSGGTTVKNYVLKASTANGIAVWQNGDVSKFFFNTPGTHLVATGSSTVYMEIYAMGGGGGGGGGGTTRTAGASGGMTSATAYLGNIVFECNGGGGAQINSQGIGGSVQTYQSNSQILDGGDGALGGQITQSSTDTIALAGANGVGNGCGASAIGGAPTAGKAGSGAGGCGGYAQITNVTGTIQAGGAGGQGSYIHTIYTASLFSPGPYTFVVGAGGTGGAATPTTNITGSAGGNGGTGYVYFLQHYT
jgi:hypothetical protein